MRDVVIVESVRTPIGRRNGALSGMHSTDLLAAVQSELIKRSGVDPSIVGQVVGGCVSQVGMQAMNITRNAWLRAGLPLEVPAFSLDTQCGSSQQATQVAYSLVSSGLMDVAVACGVEVMSRVPMGSSIPKDPAVGKPINRNYWAKYQFTTQFEAAELMAKKYDVTKQDCDELGVSSQQRAADAWAEDRFATQIVPVDTVDAEGNPGPVFTRDEALRATTLEGLAGLRPNVPPDGVHTAGTSSQIADGAAAVLMMTREKAVELGFTPRATIVDACLVGCDPVLMLEGPIPATRKLLADNKLTMDDIDVIEINEAFATVVLAWERELKPDMEKVNPNGGAIALGHPLGGTGAILVTKAMHELERTDKEFALVTMCCGGGIGTGTLLRRG